MCRTILNFALLVLVLVSVIVLGGSPRCAAQVTYQAIYLSDQAIEGIPDGVAVERVDSFSRINANGDVALVVGGVFQEQPNIRGAERRGAARSKVSGGAWQGLLRTNNAKLRFVVGTSDDANLTIDGVQSRFESLSKAWLDDNGACYFAAIVKPSPRDSRPGAALTGIWSASTETMRLVGYCDPLHGRQLAQQVSMIYSPGTFFPQPDGSIFCGLREPSDAEVSAIGHGTPNDIRPITKLGNTPPGLPSDAQLTIRQFDLHKPLAAGDWIVLDTVLAGPGLTSSTNKGLWIASTGGLEYVSWAGNPAPDGTQWNNVPRAVGFGGHVFLQDLKTKNTDGGTRYWSGRPGNLRLVQAEDSKPLNVNSVGVFRNGQVVLIETNRQVLLHGDPERLRKVIGAKDSIPGFDGMVQSFCSSLAVSPSGHFAFMVQTPQNQRIVLAGDGSSLRPVVYTGQRIVVGENDVREVKTIWFPGDGTQGWKGTEDAVSSIGQVLFIVLFAAEPGIRNETIGVCIATPEAK